MNRPTSPPDFTRPHDVACMTAVFGADPEVLGMMPAMADIPAEFRSERTPFNAIQSEWFFRGIAGPFPLAAKPGIDRRAALAHLSAIQRSFAPSHEHKSAAVAYLMSLWFEPPGAGRAEPRPARPKPRRRKPSRDFPETHRPQHDGPLCGGLGRIPERAPKRGGQR
jgi:hypothetical protein